jgi:hypothetical protein
VTGVVLVDPPGSLGVVGVSVGVGESDAVIDSDAVVDGVSLGGVGSVVSVGLQVGTSDGGGLSSGSSPGPGCLGWSVESDGVGVVTGGVEADAGGQAGSSCAPAPRPGNATAKKTPAATQSATRHSPLSRLRRVIRRVDPLCPPWPVDQGLRVCRAYIHPNEPTVPTVRPLLAPPEQDSPL